MNASDLNEMNSEELRLQADMLGLQVRENARDETIRKAIREALDAAEDDEPKPKTKTAPKIKYGHAIQPGEKIYTIEIHKDGKDRQPVYIRNNDRSVRIKRGERVQVGAAIYHSLSLATEQRYDADTGEWSEVPSYPYTVIEVTDPQ